jgi:hypothetical protein
MRFSENAILLHLPFLLRVLQLQLQCYNNHIILEDERRTALEQHMYDVRTETLKDLMVQRERQNALASQRKSEEKSKAFVENLEGDFLFNVQFENDVEGQEMLKLCTIPTKLGRSVAELYNNFKRDFLEVHNKYYLFLFIFDIQSDI